MSNLPAPVVDPYGIVRVAIDAIGETSYNGPYTPGQLGDAAVMASGMLAALGAVPAVDHNPQHPRCREGVELLGILHDIDQPGATV